MLVEKGSEGWTELSRDLHPHGINSYQSDIKGGHKELVELEAWLKEVHELFLQMATLVEEQGSILNNIEVNACHTSAYKKINYNVKRAIAYKRRTFFHSVAPCWRQNKLFLNWFM